MQGLKILLRFKIAATALLWCIPLLTFPAALFVQLGFPAPGPMLFARLLGGAYLTLLIGYWLALRDIQNGTPPTAAVMTGIVSNGLAFLIFIYAGATGEWSDWGKSAQVFMWLSTAGALLITALLLHFKRTFTQAN